jgi:hypothetical protein
MKELIKKSTFFFSSLHLSFRKYRRKRVSFICLLEKKTFNVIRINAYAYIRNISNPYQYRNRHVLRIEAH